ncbi:MAG: FHA domain-containing protein [Candidatus Aquicultor sp.]|nr:FHA domain-containing protein [Candidatus Aquicultor sp.]
MFNEVTLALQIALLVAIYLFLFFAVKAISRDLSSARLAGSDEPPRIVIEEGGPAGDIDSVPVIEQVLIGRAPDCDIILDDTFTSAHHARVYRADSAYRLEDLKSTNGTTVKGEPIVAPVNLVNNSRFKIGETTFRFVE